MEKIQNLVSEIENLTAELMTEAQANLKGNKAAGRRARKATLALTKLYKEYRTLTLEAEKAE
jgi:hypothetical protein